MHCLFVQFMVTFSYSAESNKDDSVSSGYQRISIQKYKAHIRKKYYERTA